MLPQNNLNLVGQSVTDLFEVLTGRPHLLCILPQSNFVVPSSMVISIVLKLDPGQQHSKCGAELGDINIRLLPGVLQAS